MDLTPLDRQFHIEYLADYKQHLATVAHWHHEEWRYLNPDTSLQARINRLKDHTVKGKIPTTFLGLHDKKPVGCASLVNTDFSPRQKLSPWLASVYVLPAFRNVGVGTQLVLHAMREARRLDISTLYLYTPDRQSFYARLGWQTREVCDYRGLSMTIMQHNLRSIPDD